MKYLIIAGIVLVAIFSGLSLMGRPVFVRHGEIQIQELRRSLAGEFSRGEDPQDIYMRLKHAFALEHLGIQHQAAHVFGELLYDYRGTEGVWVCDTDFSFGCFHSLFGRAIAQEGIGVISLLEQSCMDAYGPGGLGCVHGIGHGLGEYFGPERIGEQLEICKSMQWQGSLFGCSDGVFMEYHFPTDVTAQQVTTSTMQISLGNEYDPCTKTGDLYAGACYFSLPSWWIDVLERDIGRMRTLCDAVRGDDNRRYCRLGIGYAVAPVFRYDIGEVKHLCAGDVLCLAGASFGFFVNETERMNAPAVCDGTPGCTEASDLLSL